MDSITFTRDQWDEIVSAFTAMFDGLADLTEDDDGIRFLADDTGLDIGRTGTSQSFMPLHSSTMRWNEITFDVANDTVLLTAGTSTYLYRIPQRLLERRTATQL